MVILQVAHITSIPGPVQYLARYWSKRREKVYKIYHSLELSNDFSSQLEVDQKIVAKKKRHNRGVVTYLIDFFLTLAWIRRIREPIDKAVGMNCFDVLPLIVYRYFYPNKIKGIIFFNTDFSRQRFSNKFLNKIYVAIDQLSAQKADKICCNTQRTIAKRIEEGIDQKKVVYTPNGVFLEDINFIDWRQKKREKKLLYVGSLTPEHGLEEIIRNLGKTGWCLEIIGSGREEETLKKIAQEEGCQEKIKFLGRKKHEEVLEYLRFFGGWGVAPYRLGKDWSYYCDPVKVKEYLASGVPVIISSLPEVSQIIEQKNLGLVYGEKISLESVFKKLTEFSQEDYFHILKNIEELKKEWDLNQIYQKI